MKQRRTILFLTRLYHPHIGGVEKHVEIISRLFLNKGYRVIILTEQFDKTVSQHQKMEGIEIVRIPIPRNAFMKKFSIWKWSFNNISFFLKQDIIHVHDVFFWIAPILPFIFFKKIYTTFHGYEGYPVKMQWKAQRKVIEMLSRGSICVGDFMKKWYFANPTAIIYGGVAGTVTKRTSQPQSAVFFGRLDDQTGILKYIKAYELIKLKYPSFKLTVIGDGELKSKIPNQVDVLPFTSDIERYIGQNRFIFVSRYLSMLEALVQKKEVIAIYDDPIKRDYLKMSPFAKYVFIANDEREIANFVIKSIKNSKMNIKMITEGYDWAKKQTWEQIIDTYERLWKVK